MEKRVYSVIDVNRYVKSIITQDKNLRLIYVKGEISNLKYQDLTKHLFFTLKDKEASINVAMFSTYTAKLSFEPKNGDEVIVLASVDVYPVRGTYQLLAFEMYQAGLGAILIELEKLKRKLQSEGLFDLSRKRDINLYPKAIGIITAKNSAAIKDIITNIKRRYPIADIYVFPSSVQGDNAPKELLKAFLKSQEYDLDTLIIGRGGGASEDLNAFNDEALVRALAKSKMPVIAAVGHEIDMTLVDYVADKRASTPTGAAELVTIDRREIEQRLQYCLDDMQVSIRKQFEDLRTSISIAKKDLNDSLIGNVKGNIKELQHLKEVLNQSIRGVLKTSRLQVLNKKEQLEALNPHKVLSRGYSISTNNKGEIIKDISSLKKGDIIQTHLAKGSVKSIIESIEGK